MNIAYKYARARCPESFTLGFTLSHSRYAYRVLRKCTVYEGINRRRELPRIVRARCTLPTLSVPVSASHRFSWCTSRAPIHASCHQVRSLRDSLYRPGEHSAAVTITMTTDNDDHGNIVVVEDANKDLSRRHRIIDIRRRRVNVLRAMILS